MAGSRRCVFCGETIAGGEGLCPDCEAIIKEFYGEDYDIERELFPKSEERYYINTCKWDDGCGGCPYFNDCALIQA